MGNIGSGHRVPWFRVCRCPAQGKVQLALLSEALSVWHVHWDGQRDQVCRKHFGLACDLCERGVRYLWAAYSLAMLWPSQEVVIFHFPEGAIRHCPDLHQMGDKCRGLALEVERIGKARSGVRVTVKEGRMPESRMPAVATDIRSALLRLWQIKPDELGGQTTLSQQPLSMIPLPNDEPDPSERSGATHQAERDATGKPVDAGRVTSELVKRLLAARKNGHNGV